jgi:Rha family phage regulatory protein
MNSFEISREISRADLFPETLLVESVGGKAYTTSRKVAEHFHKRHKNVLRDIEKLIVDIADEAFSRLNFEPRNYSYRTGKKQLREAQEYLLTEEAFALLTMGFTGKEALRWKLDFLAAFREMERQLAAFKERESAALYAIRPRWKPIVEHPEYRRAALIELTGHRSPGSITACRRRMRQVGLLEGRAA